jgi:hypothetical protein
VLSRDEPHDRKDPVFQRRQKLQREGISYGSVSNHARIGKLGERTAIGKAGQGRRQGYHASREARNTQMQLLWRSWTLKATCWKMLEYNRGCIESTGKPVRGSSEEECRLPLQKIMILRVMHCGLMMVLLRTTCSVQVCNIISWYQR